MAYVDPRTATGLRRSVATPVPVGSSLMYTVQPPADPLPFLGLGTGWGAPQRTGKTAERQLEGAGEVLVYTKTTQTITLDITLRSTGAGTLALTQDRNSFPTLALRDGTQQVTVQLQVVQGETHVVLAPRDASAVVVQQLSVW